MTELIDLKQSISAARSLREKYAADPYRPGYHFVVPEGTHSPVDPNGALYWNGRYHLHYIYQDDGKHCWGHISSTDLLHWRNHPPSLMPGEGDDGIFSGGAFIDNEGVATISYWRLGKPDGISLARSSDENLDRWTKVPENPVIPSDEAGWARRNGAVVGTADPSQIWRSGGRYCMLTGNLLVLREFGEKQSQSEHLGDTAYLWVSDDLTNWEYLHPFYQSRREWTFDFEDCMCPDFFQLPSSATGGALSDKHCIVFISHTLGCQYYIGDYADDRFVPSVHGRMSWPPDPEQYRTKGFHDHGFFAPESLQGPDGRRIMWSWVFDHRSQETIQKSGWSGELSLPRVLWLGDDNTLRMCPAQELESLRYGEQSTANLVIKADTTVDVPNVSGNSIEIAATILPGSSDRCGIKVCRSPDGREETSIYYDATNGTLNVDCRQSSLGEGRPIVESAPFALKPGEALNLRVFVDKSVVEVYANDRQAMVRHIYPTLPQSVGVALFASGGDITVPAITGWQMMPSNAY